MDDLTLIDVSLRRRGAEALETRATDHARRPLPERLAELTVTSRFERRTFGRTVLVRAGETGHIAAREVVER